MITDTQLEFDALYTEKVEEPWRQTAEEHPWRVTHELRAQWGEYLHHANPLLRLAGAVGLSRSTELSLDEVDAVDRALQYPFPPHLVPDFIAVLLATGGNPPPILWPIYFEPNLLKKPRNQTVWLLLGWYLRQAGQNKLSTSFMAQGWKPDNALHNFVVWQGLLNPFSTVREGANLWGRAAANYHPRTLEPAYSVLEPLCDLAWWLRPDQNKPGKNAVKGDHNFWRLMTERQRIPPLPYGVAEMGDPTRSTIEQLEKLEEEYPYLVKGWKHYNPLLGWPWSEPQLLVTEKTEEKLFALLLGMPPITHSLLDLWQTRSWQPELKEYPCQSLLHNLFPSEA